MMQITWRANALTVRHETQTFNPETGSMDIAVHGEITASGECWLSTVAQILLTLRGKVNGEGTEFLLGPADADPGLIGELAAAKLRELS